VGRGHVDELRVVVDVQDVNPLAGRAHRSWVPSTSPTAS
jgi:hypothetical protein